jgi:uncharacterized protein YndB with AHSA1/START domain
MSVKKDPSGRRYIQAEVEVPGTPEEVWQAIATGPGVTSWFIPTEVTDDTVLSHFGPGMDSVAKKTAWEPPHRFAAEGEESFGPGSPAMATEWTVEARSSGTCVVRVVHSLFASGDDWDNQLEGIESGWPVFFRTLRLYLTHFRGQHGAMVQLLAMTAEPEAKTWDKLTSLLGLSGAAVGQQWKSSPSLPPLAGRIEEKGDSENPHLLLIRLDQPTPGIAFVFVHNCGQVMLEIYFYLYGAQAATAVSRDQPVWQAWLNEHFPMAGGASTSC